uniref:Dehydrogenase/reductase SDR family member 12 n=1 Tax=Timema poppense TaxID=170557 RepID=A0A7R9D7C7_TIMPO|nr:unnamed protein product [Timema poppensis]
MFIIIFRGGYQVASKNFSQSDLDVDCSGRIYMITGANSGIGKCVAQEIAQRGGTVHMLCRNPQSAETAKNEISEATNNQVSPSDDLSLSGQTNVYVHILDMSQPRSVFKFAKEFQIQNEKLDVLVSLGELGSTPTFVWREGGKPTGRYPNSYLLVTDKTEETGNFYHRYRSSPWFQVNNAGCMVNSREVDGDGLERNFATNTLGPHILTKLLIPALKNAHTGTQEVSILGHQCSYRHSRSEYSRSSALIPALKEYSLSSVLIPALKEYSLSSVLIPALKEYSLSSVLIPALKKSDKPRILMVSSGGMLVQKLNAEDLQFEKMAPFDGTMAYSQNKRQQVIMMECLAREHPDIFLAAMHPGWADTPAVRSAMPDFYQRMKDRLRTAEQGADTAVWLAISDTALKHPSGLFFQDRSPVPTHLPLAWTKTTKDQDEQFITQLNELLNKFKD